MSAQRALVLVNRAARSGNANLANALAHLKERSFHLLDEPVDAPLQIPEFIRRHAHEVDLVILGGGDGTMNLAAEALRESRSEEHTSELQSLMRISYAVFCLKQQN